MKHIIDQLDAAFWSEDTTEARKKSRTQLKRILRKLVRDSAQLALDTHERGKYIADFDSVDVDGIAIRMVP